jgi:hypothetical protein
MLLRVRGTDRLDSFDESSSDIFGASCGYRLDLSQKLARIDVIYERSADNNDNKWE